ncbi:MAG TPA: glycosyltransferase family A protein [Rhodopila sp.]
MRHVIVTTTINHPTEAIECFDDIEGFDLVVIGDRKTPGDYRLRRGLYVGPDEQERRYPRLSRLLGWNCIQRRNIGLLIALEMGADIVAVVDDDNIPLPGWGQGLLIGRSVPMRRYRCDAVAFDPIGTSNHPSLWHRGFPIQLVADRNYSVHDEAVATVRIQADFWNGDPDVDAVCRMISRPTCNFDPAGFPFTCPAFAPFNSQNTFLDARLLPEYFMFPGIGRMDDIWGGYYLQAVTGARPVFCAPSVEQRRNAHDLTGDFSREVIGYERTLPLLHSLSRDPREMFTYLPGFAVAAFLEYREIAGKLAAVGRRS